jgi:hypothetical protein
VIFFELLRAVLTLGIEQLLQTRYGILGLLCVVLLTIGLRARNATCLTVGAVLLMLLMTQAQTPS